MEFKLTDRLTKNQRKILDAFKKFGDIVAVKSLLEEGAKRDLTNCNKYIRYHKKIIGVLIENNIQPHEIFKLINAYDGSHGHFENFKIFLSNRNMCIINRVINSEEWVRYVLGIMKRNNVVYSRNIYKKTSEILIDILTNEINTFDILDYKIKLDAKNNLKNINLTIEDQKRILLSLKNQKNIIEFKKE